MLYINNKEGTIHIEGILEDNISEVCHLIDKIAGKSGLDSEIGQGTIIELIILGYKATRDFRNLQDKEYKRLNDDTN